MRPEDIVIVAGDISWATRPPEVLEDLKWLDARPGRKVLVKGMLITTSEPKRINLLNVVGLADSCA